MAYNVVSIGTSPTLIVAANNRRRQLILDNQGAVSMFYGPDNGITTSNTVSLKSGSVLTLDGPYCRVSIYGVVSSGTANVGYWEGIE